MGKDTSHRFIHTKYVDESGAWYALDNAGIIMPAVTDSLNTGLFRIELILADPVNPEVLRKALARTATRFPYFNVVLKRGVFWYYLDQCHTNPPVYPDEGSPCQNWNINVPGTRMFRVRSSGSRIAGEFTHALTDGSGGMSFMKTLIVDYFSLLGIEPGAELGAGEYADIFSVDSQPDPAEFEDGYQKYFTGSLPNPEPNPRAWHMADPMLPQGEYRVTRGVLDLKEVLDEARKRSVTLSELLGAVYLDALQELWFALPQRPREHTISVEIPVNLRQFFPTKTNRNFSLFILLRENLLLGRRKFDELVRRAHYQMKLESDPRSIARQIARNAGGTRKLWIRMVPLFLKDFFARILFAKFGETMLSGFISNLGTFRLPPGPAAQVKDIAFIPAPSTTTKVNASVISWNGRLTITFGSVIPSRELERRFFTRLRGLGFRVAVRDRHEE